MGDRRDKTHAGTPRIFEFLIKYKLLIKDIEKRYKNGREYQNIKNTKTV